MGKSNFTGFRPSTGVGVRKMAYDRYVYEKKKSRNKLFKKGLRTSKTGIILDGKTIPITKKLDLSMDS